MVCVDVWTPSGQQMTLMSASEAGFSFKDTYISSHSMCGCVERTMASS